MGKQGEFYSIGSINMLNDVMLIFLEAVALGLSSFVILLSAFIFGAGIYIMRKYVQNYFSQRVDL